MKANILAAGLILVGCALATEVSAQVTSSRDGRSVIYKGPANAAEPDYANAQPLLLPKPAFKPAVGPLNHHAPLHEKSGVMPGGRGDGKESPENIPAQKHSAVRNNLGVTPEDAGPTCGIVCQFPFTTNRVDPYFTTTTKYYPFRAAGKLFFNIGSSAYLCSASLIGQGLVVTAAHCVANYGQSQFYSNWVFVPAYSNGNAPYGKWKAASASILTAYYNGTDNCTQYGVICPDDVALIVLQPNSTGGYPGAHTGWFGWGYGGYGFYNGATEITQLGYPCNLDSCALMQRTDSYGFTDSSYSNNTIIGSEQEGGSSGGSWMVNFGQPPNGLQASDLGRNVVVGVTSWGFTDTTVMEQGAAPFTSGNIAFLWGFVGCPGPAYC